MNPPRWPGTFARLVLLAALGLAACRPADTPAPTEPIPPSATPPPVVPATSTPQASATPEATGTPTSTPAGTATLVPPTATYPPLAPSSAQGLPFGYGWIVANIAAFQPAAGVEQYPPTSFNWIKLNAEPDRWEVLCNEFRLSHNVLLQLNQAKSGILPHDAAAGALAWAQQLHQHNGSEKCVEAFQIGIAPNHAGLGEYNGPVDPEAYADQLCAMYDAIKSVDPAYIVVSGALTQTGGDDASRAVDEEIFARRMLERIRAVRGDAGGCFDAFGAQAYSFNTGFLTDPADAASCPDGICFRGVERLYGLLANEFGVDRPVWVTAFGWMRDYAAGGCVTQSWTSAYTSYPVSDEAQAQNLVNAFQLARANWPWMGAMFVANLDYNVRPWSSNPCEDPDGWFAVKGLPAEAALEAMPKP